MSIAAERAAGFIRGETVASLTGAGSPFGARPPIAGKMAERPASLPAEKAQASLPGGWLQPLLLAPGRRSQANLPSLPRETGRSRAVRDPFALFPRRRLRSFNHVVRKVRQGRPD